ncbi:hypothetical protein ABEB36_004334 [Hypothenemus hampei]|uniref:Uncharacterized protein n=1 Tax=Hypothenemus hampei TaxID=57062 RepID=A0ABD1F314_HYPHA
MQKLRNQQPPLILEQQTGKCFYFGHVKDRQRSERTTVPHRMSHPDCLNERHDRQREYVVKSMTMAKPGVASSNSRGGCSTRRRSKTGGGCVQDSKGPKT